MSDWIGLAFFVLLIVGVFIGLKMLAKPRITSSDEFERNASENTTMMGAGLSALQGILDPSAAKAKEVRTELRRGRYNKKKREGKANADDND